MKRINKKIIWSASLALTLGLSLAPANSPRLSDLKSLGRLRSLPALNAGVNIERNIAWAWPEAHPLRLDVFRPEADGTYPIVVNIHGGGWTFGNKEMDESLCRYLARRGYVIFNINYRLAPVHRFPDQVNDSLGAVIWAKDHAEEFKGDPDRVAVMGDSAGANLSAMVAFAHDYDGFDPTFTSRDYDASVQAAVLIYGVYDMTIFDSLNESWGAGLVYNYLGGPQSRFPERYVKASPVHYLPRQAPMEILILAGDRDTYYPQSVDFKRELDRIGIRYRFYTVKGAEHGFISYGYSKEAKEAFTVIADFLDRNLKK